MNNDDDFGGYNCIAENIHGREDAMVFVMSMYSYFNEEELVYFVVVEESVILSTLTTKKLHRHPKKFDFTQTYLQSTTINVYNERDIHISSSSSHRWTLNHLLLVLLLLFRLRRIHR